MHEGAGHASVFHAYYLPLNHPETFEPSLSLCVSKDMEGTLCLWCIYVSVSGYGTVCIYVDVYGMYMSLYGIHAYLILIYMSLCMAWMYTTLYVTLSVCIACI